MFQVELIWQKQSKITPVYKKEFLCAVKFWYKLLNPTEIFQIKRTLYFLYVAHSTEKRNCQISCKADVKIWSFKAIVTCFPVYFLCCIQKPFGCTTPSYRPNVQNKYKNLSCAFRGCSCKCRSLLWVSWGGTKRHQQSFQMTLLLFLIKKLTISTCCSKKAHCSFKDAVLDIHYNRQFFWKQIDLPA